jgi:flagellar biosynthesis protein FlhA
MAAASTSAAAAVIAGAASHRSARLAHEPGRQGHRLRRRHRTYPLPLLPARPGFHDRFRPCALDRARRADPDGRAQHLDHRLILSRGEQGPTSAGYIIGGFARLVMGGDFVIGIIVFLILVTINFLVITKGATRIAEVGARFTLDSIPGKQMAIVADLSAGLIDEKMAQARRRELEEENAFFGSKDGAPKFVCGDAIPGLIILAVNIFGGIVIGVTRHGLALAAAADVFAKLSVGDGLVTQIPALIISLAAGLLVAKGGTRGSADKAVIDQLSGYPNALFLAALTMAVLGVVPDLPFLPFALLGGLMAFVGVAIPRRIERERVAEAAKAAAKEERTRPRLEPRSRSGSNRSR